ncbi:hypothetical protein L917_00313 [Phytophthora nicotianae]|uniref:Uncharacterized protein n=1 Tax=Phytophthora nicotianae TaxID=4792 RepID=W2M3F2_PHYNI|nr:hypothetical protein L917_00313 [Phytophthora nicotianae]
MTEVPADVYEIPGLQTLGLGQLNLNELPRNVMNPAASLIAIFLDGTNISYFWPWMDDSVTMETWGILIAPLTPYCSDLEAIKTGLTYAFSAPPSPDYARMRMDPSKANLPSINYVDSCDPYSRAHIHGSSMPRSLPIEEAAVEYGFSRLDYLGFTP